ncbi:hypothetical protein [Flavobacterium chilense]|uniref:Uncharacterized protein n=1 Tax=Flavobacterium chilense TaxID=946677 RepID=A0A1M7IU27_9FLAO|nr:hypothetical protein [Flavobacterium chilense]SHM44123.1 hypothetical protein SAMN05444484_10644 [Flavobacterium chilense]
MKKNISKLIAIVIVVGIVFLFVKGYLYKKEIRENRKKTVCKFTFCKIAPKTTTSFFKYIVNNKRYRNSYGQCPDSCDMKINKFFILYYSSKDPNKIEVDLSKQITDTTAILNAGFSKEEL